MSSSNDDVECVVKTVSDYCLVDENDNLVSFSELPVQWSNIPPDTPKLPIMLHGLGDGHVRFLDYINAWRLETSHDEPELSVHMEKGHWIKLEKPKKLYMTETMDMFVILYFIHYLKKNPEASKELLWNHLQNVELFRVYGLTPAKENLMKHRIFIRTAAKDDETLAKSQLIRSVIGSPQKRKASREDICGKSNFIAKKSNEASRVESGTGCDHIDSDSMCAFCDNGGNLLCCDGKCYRSFHANTEDGADSKCESLCLKEEVENIQSYLCPNCKYKQHQCFGCGKLGSSDTCDPEVFRCHSVACGHFYHPSCVSKLSHPKNATKAQRLEKKISMGNSFTCPVHKCHICKEAENKDRYLKQFALCRRCPKAYHRGCLPREIGFEFSTVEGDLPRAWNGLLPKRVLIYCLDHEIDIELQTPKRDHIHFPTTERKNMTKPNWKRRVGAKREFALSVNPLKKDHEERPAKVLIASLGKVAVEKLKAVNAEPTASLKRIPEERLKEVCQTFTNPLEMVSAEKPKVDNEAVSTPLEEVSGEKLEDVHFEPTAPFQKVTEERLKEVNQASISILVEVPGEKSKVDPIREVCSVMEGDQSDLKSEEEDLEDSFDFPETDLEDNIVSGSVEMDKSTTLSESKEPLRGRDVNVQTLLEEETKSRLVSLMKAESSITLRGLLKNFINHTRTDSNNVEGGVALSKLESCVEVLETNPQKPAEEITNSKIVEKLHSYCRMGDMIVDIYCDNSNFNQSMKQRLEKSGKDCEYRAFAAILPKSDPKGDQVDLDLKNLSTGSKLVIVLNVDFGNEATSLRKLMDKVLGLYPKLLLLVFTNNIERLKAEYDMVWEDNEKLSLECGYLPESVTATQLEQWNSKPALMYLWSRRDCTESYRRIAMTQSHIPKNMKDCKSPEEIFESIFSCFSQISYKYNEKYDEQKISEYSSAFAKGPVIPYSVLETSGITNGWLDESPEPSRIHSEEEEEEEEESCGNGWFE